MYRAYPAPSQNGHDRTKKQHDGSSSAPSPSSASALASGPPRGIGNFHRNATSSSGPVGLSSPILSPMKPVAPPSKKQRGSVPPQQQQQRQQPQQQRPQQPQPQQQPYKSTTDEFTKLANEGIEKRRAELRHLKSNRSSTADLLERARAVTSSNNNKTNTNGNSNGLTYSTSTRTRSTPRATSLTRSPPKRNSRATMNRNPNHLQIKVDGSNGNTNIYGNAANGNVNVNINVPRKPRSPNQKVNVHTSVVRPSEISNIKPLTSIKQQTQIQALTQAQSQTQAQTQTQSPSLSTPTSKSSSVPTSTTTTTTNNNTTSNTTNNTTNANTTNKTNQLIRHEEEKKVEHSPSLVTEQSKRDTLRFLRDAALSPPLHIVKKNARNEQMKQNMNMNKIEKDDVVRGRVLTGSSSNDTNNQVVGKSSHSKIMKELLEAKELRENALKQVAQLEKEVLDLRLKRDKSTSMSTKDYDGSGSRHGRSRSLNRSSSTRRKRMKSPQPANRTRTDAKSNPLSDDNIACRAVETVEDVYSSDLAIYVVRKPYGGNEAMEYSFPQHSNSNSHNNNFSQGSQSGSQCKISWHESVKKYLQSANVQEEASIEVIAKINADNSVLLLHESSCRHGIAVLGNDGNTVGYEWKNYDDIEKMDGSLGRIIYIDSDGNDGEYWLDSIYEDALKIRENYCSNVFSAALALSATPEKQETPKFRNHQMPTFEKVVEPQLQAEQFPGGGPPQPTTHDAQMGVGMGMGVGMDVNAGMKVKPKTSDACVGTADDPQFQPTKEEKSPKSKPSSERKKPIEEIEEAQSGSTDAFSSFVIFFFGTIFSFIWFTVCIPFKIMKWTIIASMFYGMVSILWLYFADDNGAMGLGAGIDYHLNPPGIH